jgi:hypothetical protein
LLIFFSLRAMSSSFRRKCPFCGGDLLRSRSHQWGYTSYFWKKPWKRAFFDWGEEKVFPWACMGCGVVLFYLDRLPQLAEEYRTVRNPEEVPVGAPEPLKS